MAKRGRPRKVRPEAERGGAVEAFESALEDVEASEPDRLVEDEDGGPASRVGRLVAGEPSTLALEKALETNGLEAEHVAAWVVRIAGVTVITKGGRKILPGEIVSLSPAEKDGVPRSKGRPAGFLRPGSYKAPAR